MKKLLFSGLLVLYVIKILAPEQIERYNQIMEKRKQEIKTRMNQFIEKRR
jgi:hypothetical protein